METHPSPEQESSSQDQGSLTPRAQQRKTGKKKVIVLISS